MFPLMSEENVKTPQKLAFMKQLLSIVFIQNLISFPDLFFLHILALAYMRPHTEDTKTNYFYMT